MKFAVMGSGGVGGYFGGRLAEAGHDVAFLARGAHLAAIRERGLRVFSTEGDFELSKARATDSPEEIGPVDVVLLAVKTWQVAEAAARLSPLLGPTGAVLTLQNGVEAPDEVARACGRERVLAGVCRLIFIAPFSAVGAATRKPAGAWRHVKETRALLAAAMNEVVDLARARGVFVPREAVDRTLAFVDKLPEDATASMQRDLLEGRPSELEAQTGAIVRQGREAGIETPANAFLYSVLLPAERAASVTFRAA